MSKPQGLLFLVIGPPGVGKNALMNDALKHFDDLRQLATATTRRPRPTEQEGREHLFVSPETFREMIARNELLEWQEVHPNKFYGVPRASIENALASGEKLIADIDVLGATYIRSLYPGQVVLIYIEPPSVAVLEERMQQRGESRADIDTRLKRVAMELTFMPVADYTVFNDDFAAAARQFRTIIEAEGERLQAGRPPRWNYSYSVVTIPVAGGEALYRMTAPEVPATSLADGELPHKAALYNLSAAMSIEPDDDCLLRLKANKGSFISPAQISVSQNGDTKHITFTYVYLLPEEIQPGAEWMRRPVTEIDLPASIQQRLAQQAGIRETR